MKVRGRDVPAGLVTVTGTVVSGVGPPGTAAVQLVEVGQEPGTGWAPKLTVTVPPGADRPVPWMVTTCPAPPRGGVMEVSTGWAGAGLTLDVVVVVVVVVVVGGVSVVVGGVAGVGAGPKYGPEPLVGGENV